VIDMYLLKEKYNITSPYLRSANTRDRLASTIAGAGRNRRCCPCRRRLLLQSCAP